MSEPKSAQQALNDALTDPTEDMRKLARVGVDIPITRWQKWLLKIPYRRTYRMQKYILKNLKKKYS